MSVSAPERTQTITPEQGESYSAFVWRAHYSLLPSVPNPEQRNEKVWNAWENTYGDPQSDRAEDYFPADKYQHAKNVPYFAEHVMPRKDGSSIVYDFNELSRIVDAANERCDTDSYSAISSHHTDDKLKGPLVEPAVVGYAGPYRLGMIGTNKPKWAVFADEHHENKYSQLFSGRRRRSVEVLRPKNGDPSYFDPIATLGSDSPRLPLPVARYESNETEVERFRYSMPASFSAVGAGNTFIPGSQDRDRYESPSQPSSNPSSNSPEQPQMSSGYSQLTPDDVQQIVQALMATPQMAWVTGQMDAGDQNPQAQLQSPTGHMPQAPAAPSRPPMAPSNNPGQQPGQQPPSQHQAMPNLSVPPGAGGSGPQPQQHQRYSATTGQEEDVDVERYTAIESELIETRERYSQLEAKHEQLAAVNAKAVEQLATLHKSLYAMESRTVDSDRTGRIKDLYAAYPHMVEVEEELDRCLYSRGANMDTEAFEAHCNDIERYAKRSPMSTVMVPQGSFANTPIDQAKAEEISNRAVHRYSQESAKNIYRDFDEIRDEIMKEMGLKA
jgi:hypothetical protein